MTPPTKKKKQRTDAGTSKVAPALTDEQVRSLAAGAKTRRIRSGHRWFTVYMDRLGADMDDGNIHWLNRPSENGTYEPDRPFRANGVLLSAYQVICDDDPTLEITVTLSPPSDLYGRLRITKMTYAADELTAVAMPMGQLRDACIYVGAVTGLWWTKGLQLPNGKTVQHTQYTITLGTDAVPFHPEDLAELTGTTRVRRGSRFAPETLRAVWDAIQDYERENSRLKAAGLPRLGNLHGWVAKQTGQNQNNIGKQMKAAREMYGAKKGRTK